MKKILASALLAGLLFGTTTTVFAVEGPSQKTTDVTGSVAAQYVVTIPSELSINLTDGSLETNKALTIGVDSLTAAGSILVTPEFDNLILTVDGVPVVESKANQEVNISLKDTDDTDVDSFNLKTLETKEVKVVPTENSDKNIAGSYTGSIIFNLEYAPAAAAADPA